MQVELHLMLLVGFIHHPREQVVGRGPRNARYADGRRAHDRTHQAHHCHVHALIVPPEGAREQRDAAR